MYLNKEKEKKGITDGIIVRFFVDFLLNFQHFTFTDIRPHPRSELNSFVDNSKLSFS